MKLYKTQLETKEDIDINPVTNWSVLLTLWTGEGGSALSPYYV